jgi:hypothetical protein
VNVLAEKWKELPYAVWHEELLKRLENLKQVVKDNIPEAWESIEIVLTVKGILHIKKRAGLSQDELEQWWQNERSKIKGSIDKSYFEFTFFADKVHTNTSSSSNSNSNIEKKKEEKKSKNAISMLLLQWS